MRELEGALKRVLAYSNFHGQEISLPMAKDALRDLLAVQNRQISIENIQKTVADYYKIRISDMHSKKRSRAVARPRQVAMALAKELTQLSLPRDRQQLRRPRPHDRAARLPPDRQAARNAPGPESRRQFPAAGAAKLSTVPVVKPAFRHGPRTLEKRGQTVIICGLSGRAVEPEKSPQTIHSPHSGYTAVAWRQAADGT